MKPQRLPDAEFDIMELIWQSEPPVTSVFIWESIGKPKGIKLQTVSTLLGRLEARGFLRIEKGAGRERHFFAVISREDYLRMETDFFVSHYHKKSYASLLNALSRERLSKDDLDELSEWIDSARTAQDSEA